MSVGVNCRWIVSSEISRSLKEELRFLNKSKENSFVLKVKAEGNKYFD